MRPDDRAALVALWIKAWQQVFPEIDFTAREPFVTDRLSRPIGPHEYRFVAEQPEGAAGFLLLDAATGEIDQIAVAPAHWGDGSADALIAAAKAAARVPLWLWVNTDNTRALAFYARHGFEPTVTGTNPGSGKPTLRLEEQAIR